MNTKAGWHPFDFDVYCAWNPDTPTGPCVLVRHGGNIKRIEMKEVEGRWTARGDATRSKEAHWAESWLNERLGNPQ